MYDEFYCHAELPDGRDPRGTCFHLAGTKVATRQLERDGEPV